MRQPPLLRFRVAGILALLGCTTQCDATSPNDRLRIEFVPQIVVSRGLSTEVILTVTRTDSIGAATLSAGELPAGVTATFSPATISDDTRWVKLNLTAAENAPTGDRTVTIAATGDKVDYQVYMPIVVQVRGDYSLTLPVSIVVGTGATQAVIVNLNPLKQFAQTVSLSVGPPVAGITTTLSPSSIDASGANKTATLTISAAAASVVGTRLLTITGTTEGLPDRTQPFEVIVEPRSIVLNPERSSLDLVRGRSSSLNVGLTLVNYGGTVFITASGLPAGVSAHNLGVAAVGSTNTVITFSATESADLGPATITLSTSGAGVPAATTTFTLNVKNP